MPVLRADNPMENRNLYWGGILLFLYLAINLLAFFFFANVIWVKFLIGTSILIILIKVPGFIKGYRRRRNDIERLLATLAETRGENRQLNQDLNKAVFEILALFEFTSILGDNSDFERMLEQMVDTIKRILDYDGCCLFFIDETKKQLFTKVNRGFPAVLNTTRIPEDQFLTGHVIRTGQALLINEFDSEYRYYGCESLKYRNLAGRFQSFVAVPLLVQNKPIGILLIAKRPPFALTQDDLRLLFIIANQAALAIQNMRLYDEVYQSSITDGLTGVYNHRYFREELEARLSEAEVLQVSLSLLMLDIDNFKGFNDTYGHQVGDFVLKEVAGIITETLGDGAALVARYGGEEFAVILPNTNTRTAVRTAELLRSAVSTHHFSPKENDDIHSVTISVGVASFPEDIKNMARKVEELIDKADESLYAAKNTGRNRVCSIAGLAKKNMRKVNEKGPI
jgi:diguanylate cyclase (GGDEF)-like protein